MATKVSPPSAQLFLLLSLILWPSISAKSGHFVLVHGACHGAWCWYKLVSLLQDAGHKVTALDLAASGIDTKQVSDLHTIDDYHEPLYSYLKALSPDDKVILVGHSMGGFAVSSAMERFPEKIAFAVFVAAQMLGPELSIYKLVEHYNPGMDIYGDSKFTTDGNPLDPLKILYQHSPRQDLALASLLMRESKAFNDDESRRQLLVTKEKFGSIARAYFVAGDDKIIPVDLQRWMVQNNPPDLVRVIDGADHMVMISKPEQLYNYLLEIAVQLKNYASI
ncbi:salicylic acid-binding protein 2-like [Coffea eugenioides]|uniref:salicylic acid-binding protein 2-like n=1 Tax=Coffea eugenioides TaxID=49369 RepID=UPI000F60D31F|nr:salicylic acid-binding protein 2-like [Coffea eugenioides]